MHCTGKGFSCLLLAVTTLLPALVPAIALARDEPALTVLYPQVKAPYDEIFRQIISGVQQQHTGDVSLVQLSSAADVERLTAELQQAPDRMVIALGKSGYQVAQKLPAPHSVVVGALPIQPNGVAGVSLLAEPAVLFSSLKMLAPSIRRVLVLYTATNSWLIERAAAQSRQLGLELVATEVTDLKDAVSHYQQLMKSLDPNTDALWLPLDSVTANEQVVLPQLLEFAWERNLVLFSSKPEHARRGALFSAFPDHRELGRELVRMVEQLHQKKITAAVVPMRQVQLAVNLRTAAHLGMEYSPEVRRHIAITFQK